MRDLENQTLNGRNIETEVHKIGKSYYILNIKYIN
jgi:hypothetical protein